MNVIAAFVSGVACAANVIVYVAGAGHWYNLAAAVFCGLAAIANALIGSIR